MLIIHIPNNNIPEREYIIDTLFSDYLGLKYRCIPVNATKHYSIKFNNVELNIKDCFFSKFPESLSYLKEEALPNEISYSINDFTIEQDIPVIFGSDEISVSGNAITCGLDIFGSSFFMLSRWEEFVNKVRDSHLRFPGKESVAFKNNFMQRPVVNEYVEMLWGMLQRLGFKEERKQRAFELVLTHDIDQLDYPNVLRILAGDLLKRKNLMLAGKNILSYLKSGRNPYDTFDFMMSISERLGVKSHFYFMSSDIGKPPDNDYFLEKKRFRKRIQEIRDRGHIIGFHPGYFTFNDGERWIYEKQMLEEAAQVEVSEGRQHFLRLDFPATLRLWNANGMRIDGTLGYAEIEGYRCGTGDLFKIFDFLDRKPLQLLERPLVIMDGSLKRYSNDQALTTIRDYIGLAKKYKSTLTLLFHNTTFYGENWAGYDNLYQSALGDLDGMD